MQGFVAVLMAALAAATPAWATLSATDPPSVDGLTLGPLQPLLPSGDPVGFVFLLSDLAGAVTGEVHYVDCGYNVVAMPTLDALKAQDQGRSPSEAAE